MIQHITRYSTGLCRVAVDLTEVYLKTLPTRTSWPSPYQEKALQYYDAVAHVLRLSEACVEENARGSLIADRAELSVVHTALLVHLHAQVIRNDESREIVAFDSNRMGGMYARCVHFATAHQKLQECIILLEVNGGKLDNAIEWFLER